MSDRTEGDHIEHDELRPHRLTYEGGVYTCSVCGVLFGDVDM